ncbi:hypothetical protein P9858_13135 [Niallia circulans]|nr:hypothetical protein [Niallia circulans]
MEENFAAGFNIATLISFPIMDIAHRMDKNFNIRVKQETIVR